MNVIVFSLLLISLIAPAFATDAELSSEAEFSQVAEKSVKGFGWSLSSKVALLKSRFLRGENKIDYLLDISKQYVDEIEKETYAGDINGVQKTHDAYANVLDLIENELKDASSEARIEAEQALLVQSQRLGYLSAAVELAKGNSEYSPVEESKDQSQHLLKTLSKEKRKVAILKARETNKTDEEIENETRTEEKEISQDFAVRASQFIIQAEHAIEKAEQKGENGSNVLLHSAKESLLEAQSAYENEQYLLAIQHAFESKHAALKVQSSANASVETDAENTNASSAPLKKVVVKKKEEVKNRVKEVMSSQDPTNLITGKVIERLGHGNDKESIETSSSVDDATKEASNGKISPSETPKLKEDKDKAEKDKENKKDRTDDLHSLE